MANPVRSWMVCRPMRISNKSVENSISFCGQSPYRRSVCRNWQLIVRIYFCWSKPKCLKKEGLDIRINRFLVEGEGNIKYTYNNGIIAKDEKLASLNFLNALEKLPAYIEQEQKKITETQKTCLFFMKW